MCELPDKRLTSRLLTEVLRVFTSSSSRHNIGKQFSFEAAAQRPLSLSAAILPDRSGGG
jgi:hypothetical protein